MGSVTSVTSVTGISRGENLMRPGLSEVEEQFEERAAIMQFDGGLSREQAERAAWEAMRGCNHE